MFVMVVPVVVIVIRGPGMNELLTRREPVTARPFEWALRLQECRVPRQGALEIEGAEVEHTIQRQFGTLRAHQRRRGVDAAQFLLDARQLRGADQVGLVEQQHIAKADLAGGDGRVAQLPADMRGIDQRDHGIQAKILAQVFIDEEGLRHGSWVSKPGGLDEHVVETIAPLAQLAEHTDQVATHGAADATVGGLEDLFLGTDHQFMVDGHFAEFVLDDGDALAVLLREDAVEQRGLAGAEKTGEHRNRYA